MDSTQDVSGLPKGYHSHRSSSQIGTIGQTVENRRHEGNGVARTQLGVGKLE